MNKSVHLGFEVGTGIAVEIPIAHMVVTGQTQAAGKTTTMEALVHRSGIRALAFRTKRGESAFGSLVHQVKPYFRERADWRFVSAILEASLGERMKFERSWIMRATKGARTLDDVRRNVRTLGEKSKGGMSADMFMMLGEYLDDVVPELRRVTFASRVDLNPGANVVDLGALSLNVQGLVISSMLSWVHEHEDGVVIVLPEAWKFIPQGKNSPVRMAAISLAREGGALGNLIWLDSQDLAGAEKEVVRQASVYLLGVQREANEIKRTLAHIPAGIKKPKAADIATLERGQFFACWGTHAIRTYVQPAWLTETMAQQISLGNLGQAHLERAPAFWPRPALRETTEEHGATVLTDDQPINEDTQEDDMTPDQEKKLDSLIDAVTALTEAGGKTISIHQKFDDADPDRISKRYLGGDPVAAPSPGTDEEAMYQRFVARLKKEAPTLLKVLVIKPSIEVSVETYVLELDGKTLKGKLAEMISQHWFDEPKVGNAAYNELQRKGFATAKPNVYRELDALAALGFLTKEPDGFLAVKDMKVNIKRK